MKHPPLRSLLATAVVTLMFSAVFASGGAVALDYESPNPMYSYFEGLRGRLTLATPAITDDPTCVWINPALLGTGKAGGVAYLHTYEDSTFSGDDAFSIALGGLAFGAEFYDLRNATFTPEGLSVSMQNTRRYTFALASKMAHNIYVGTSYSWLASQNAGVNKGDSWALGLVARPHRKISLGFVARDLNSPDYYGTEFKPIYETSLGIRPIDERLTLFADWFARADKLKGGLPEQQPESFLAYGIEYTALDGLTLRIGADEDRNLSASVLLSVGTGSLGTAATRNPGEDGEKDRSYGTVIVSAGPFWHESVLTPPRNYVDIHLDGAIGETRPPFSLLTGGGPKYVLRDLVQKIEQAKNSRDISAIVLRCGDIGAGFAVLDELRQALLDFKAGGKKVVAYVVSPGNGGYYLATASDYIVLQPGGYIGLVGLKSESLFLRGTLDTLGIKAYYARVGKYKSAVEPLTEDKYTDPSREAEEALLDDVFEKMISDIASGRAMSAGEVRAKIDRGPFIPSEALREGLVDTLAYQDELPGIVNAVAHGSLRRVGFDRFSGRSPADPRWDEPPVIGIVYGVGGIMQGTNRRDLLFGEVMGSETITRALRAMREDDDVAAVVFRVDSPGGVMTASDEIRREVKITAGRKPVIISMGGVAASGGYHVSCDGTMIVADETTVTGSIGVLNLWLHTRGLYRKIGANKDIFLRGEHADIFPTWRDVTEEDLELAQYYVDKYYDKFIRDVADGRAMSIEEVNTVAQGRVWSGKRAEELGLVDRIGGLAEAVRLAKQEAGIDLDRRVKFKILPRPGGFLSGLRRAAGASITESIGIPEDLGDFLGDAAYWAAYDEPVLYLMPYKLEVR